MNVTNKEMGPPTTAEEWIDLFNRTSELLGYPDARDDFHPRDDLRNCLESCASLLRSFDLVRWPPVVGTTARGGRVPVTVPELNDAKVNQYLESVEREISAADILPRDEVHFQRGVLKLVLTEMEKAAFVRKRLHLITLKETIEKHGPPPEPGRE